MAKNKFNKAWMHEHLSDPYVKQARHAGYRSRAAYKLKEIAEQDKLIRPGIRVLDLGAAPGSWSQFLRNTMVGTGGEIRGTIIALDLLEMEPVAGVHFLQGDFREEVVWQQLVAVVGEEPLDLIVSDMAPNLSGVALADAARMMHIGELTLEFALAHLKRDGALLMKSFHGSQYSQLVELLKKHFRTVAPRKPKASRDKSSEIFLLCKGLK
ncbi:MAG: RlmE family RNA methyltransferase [Burkholderiaceae bacterium]|jgi:23S rRNA (uridine2552-2'-O)-methyltransferase